MLLLLTLLLSFILNNFSFANQYGVDWKLKEQSHLGYLWKNSDIVFVEPDLRAIPVSGVSKSGKICGFEILGKDKELFFVSQIGQGLAEVRVQPSILDLELARELHEKTKQFSLFLEAYDCDVSRHYSPQMMLKIIQLNEDTIELTNKEYKWSVRKDAKMGSVIGSVEVIQELKNSGLFSFRILELNINNVKIDSNGKILVSSDLRKLISTSMTFQVLVEELDPSRKVKRKAIAQVILNLIPSCQPEIIGIPDEMEYYMNSKKTKETLKRNRLLQSGNMVTMETCQKQNGRQMAQISADISIKIKNQNRNHDNKEKVCLLSRETAEIRNGFCTDLRSKLAYFQTSSSGISKENNKNLGYDLVGIGEEFTIFWWMRRVELTPHDVICFSDPKNKIPLMIITYGSPDCSITITIATTPSQFQTKLHKQYQLHIPNNICHKLNEWYHVALMRDWSNSVPTFSLAINGQIVGSVVLDQQLIRLNQSRVHVGNKCGHRIGDVDSTNSGTEIRTVVINTKTTLSSSQLKCLVDCQDNLVFLSDGKITQSFVAKYGPSLEFKNVQVDKLTSILRRISFLKLNFTKSNENQNTKIEKFKFTDLNVSLKIKYFDESANKLNELVFPDRLIRINYDLNSLLSKETLGLPNSSSSSLSSSSSSLSSSSNNGTGSNDDDNEDDVEIILKNNGKIVFNNKRNVQDPIALLKGIKIQLSSESEDEASSSNKNLIDSCSVRPYGLQFQPGEQLLLDNIGHKLALKFALRESMRVWQLEGRESLKNYAEIMEHLQLVTSEERRKFIVTCLLASDEYTSQAMVELIQKPIYIINNEPDLEDVNHHAVGERLTRQDLFERPSKPELLQPPSSNIYTITKPRFVAIIIMAVVGGAAWSLVTAAVSCYLLKRRHNNQIRRTRSHVSYSASGTVVDGNSTIMMPLSTTTSCMTQPPFSMTTSLSNGSSFIPTRLNPLIDAKYPPNVLNCEAGESYEDQLSLSDLPRCIDDEDEIGVRGEGDEEFQHDFNGTCQLCNEEHDENDITGTVHVTRSHTVTFPITNHPRF